MLDFKQKVEERSTAVCASQWRELGRSTGRLPEPLARDSATAALGEEPRGEDVQRLSMS